MDTIVLNILEHVLPSFLTMESAKVEAWCNAKGTIGTLIWNLYQAFSSVIDPATGTIDVTKAATAGAAARVATGT